MQRDQPRRGGGTIPDPAASKGPGAQAQPDPKKMQAPPLRTNDKKHQDRHQDKHQDKDTPSARPQQRDGRGSPNVHMEPAHEGDPAATAGERPKFDR